MINKKRSKITTKDWIKKAKEVHGRKFSYHKTIYIRAKDKVKISCKLHGVFQQTASKHQEGSGCKKCNIESQRKTTAEFIKDSKRFHGDYYDYSLVSFKSVHDKVIIICPVHGNFNQSAVTHQKGKGCKKCSIGEVWNKKDFVKNAKKTHKNKFNYTKVKYVNTSTKIEIKCKTCKTFFKQTPNAHLKGIGCANCMGNIPITEEMFIEILKDVHKNEITLLSKYINKTTTVKVKHICGHIWKNTPSHLISRKQGCRKCYNSSQRFTDRIFKKRLKEEHNGKIISLEKYRQSKIPIKLQCLNCEKIYKVQPRSVLRNGCHSCANRKSNDEFLQDLQKAHGEEIIALERYKSVRDKIKVQHKCGHIWKVDPADLIRKKHGCPRCAKSKGNKEIYDFLQNKKIKFETEKRFNSCKYKIPLPFDFYIPSKKILIEYDGEQHFIAIDFWGGEAGLLERIIKDKIKNSWSKKNGYTLYRIRFDENIIQKLVKIISPSTSKHQ